MITFKELTPVEKVKIFKEFDALMREKISNHTSFVWLNAESRKFMMDFKEAYLNLVNSMYKDLGAGFNFKDIFFGDDDEEI